MHVSSWLPLCSVLALLVTRTAAAEPRFTELSKVADKNTSVVIAEFVGPIGTTKVYEAFAFELDVERTVRGPKRSGRIKVLLGAGHPDVKIGARIVAFIDSSDRFSFVAEPLPGHTIEGGALMVRGFYDFNAHMVGPSMISLAQLERFIDTGALDYRFVGDVHVLSPDGARVVASKIRLTVDYDLASHKARVAGFPKSARNFPKQPTVRITPGWGPHVTVIYRDHWPRPLKIGGTIVGVDRHSGAFQVRFHVTEPDLLTADHLTRYLANGKHSYQMWHYQISLADGRKWQMSDGHDYSGNTTITTDGGDRYQYTSFSFAKADPKDRYVELRGAGKPLRIDFGPRRAGAFLDERGTLRSFHQELLHGALDCRVVAGDGKGQRCSITVTSMKFAAPIKAP